MARAPRCDSGSLRVDVLLSKHPNRPFFAGGDGARLRGGVPREHSERVPACGNGDRLCLAGGEGVSRGVDDDGHVGVEVVGQMQGGGEGGWNCRRGRL